MKKILLKSRCYLQNVNEKEFLKNKKVKERYKYEWLSGACCGIACLKICIKYFLDKNISIVKLVEKSLEYSVLQEGVGSIHYNLIQLARSYGLEGCVIKEEREDRFKTLINFMLSNNILVIASVRARILKGNTEKKGGHLVVIRGMDKNNLYINDPHHVENFSKLNRKVDFERFFDNFSGNMICISKKQ